MCRNTMVENSNPIRHHLFFWFVNKRTTFELFIKIKSLQLERQITYYKSIIATVHSIKYKIDKGSSINDVKVVGGGGPKLRDVIYGRPLTKFHLENWWSKTAYQANATIRFRTSTSQLRLIHQELIRQPVISFDRVRTCVTSRVALFSLILTFLYFFDRFWNFLIFIMFSKWKRISSVG